MPTEPNPDEIPLPALLRAARGAYGVAITARLDDADYADMPRNGPFVLGGLAREGETLGDLIAGLGVSKQAASQLIDTLVVRGYLTREVHPEDRRRMVVRLTDRGRTASETVRGAVAEVDDLLGQRIGPADVASLRRGLSALAAIKAETVGSGRRPR
ncbi:MAG TPA: MarR family winged helix-turn-helix transcriptional regulator [Jatrophihabitans sp.]|nr:MarR family winged helix-turn-helix transcriptional regulator [Jatrophihabitans sp.]